MEQFDKSISEIITICGTFSFAVSGAFAAMQKRLDVFGVLIIAFATSIGGGTLRDVLLGDTPVFWLKSAKYFPLNFSNSNIVYHFLEKN